MARMAEQKSEPYSKTFGACFQDEDRRKMVYAIKNLELRQSDILLEAFREWFARRFPGWRQ